MGNDHTGIAVNHPMFWGAAVFLFFVAVITVWRGEFKFSYPVPPIRRSDFPEGYWPLVAILFAAAGWVVWLALQP